MNDFPVGRPKRTGWHNVIFELGDKPSRVYVWVSPDYVSWGWDEEDDPELITEESIASGDTRFEEAV